MTTCIGFVISLQSVFTQEQKFPNTLHSGPWKAGHVQGIAVDQSRGHIYYSFTTLLIKTDLQGKLIGSISGFTGHLGDLEFNENDRRLYGSLEYKAQEAFYIAIIDADRIQSTNIHAQNSDIFRTVYLNEVVQDYTADMNHDGVFDGDKADTPDHRYGCSGIDGVSFGPRFGRKDGKHFLTVAYGIYANRNREDNNYQVLLQYDTARWWSQHAKVLNERTPHRSGPEKVDGKYFVYTGNTTYGVQTLTYDPLRTHWLMGVYKGIKGSFPNYTLFAVEATAQPVREELAGTGGKGMVLPLAQKGLQDVVTGIRGWHQKADVGVVALGNGLFYLTVNHIDQGMQSAELFLSKWTGEADSPFQRITPPQRTTFPD